jgi:hypothetical protein
VALRARALFSEGVVRPPKVASDLSYGLRVDVQAPCRQWLVYSTVTSLLRFTDTIQ